MVNSPILGVAIGLVFAFASVALMASTAKEFIASILGLRARTLFSGIKDILNDQNFKGLALDLYNHALINPRGNGSIPPGTSFWDVRNFAPAYIDSTHFAAALVESIQKSSATEAPTLATSVQDPQIKALIAGMEARAKGDLDNVRQQLAAWFDNSMDRLSGLYKRWAQLICFLCGLAIAITLNVDAVHMAKTLWADPVRTANVVATSVGEVEQLDKLRDLPVGENVRGKPWDYIAWDGLGVIITASAAMFGAPFWFDMLQRLVQLRSTSDLAPEATSVLVSGDLLRGYGGWNSLLRFEFRHGAVTETEVKSAINNGFERWKAQGGQPDLIGKWEDQGDGFHLTYTPKFSI